ncbi:hypothetical protein Fleli_3933 [Bernardetia litoralis DSM 6794]|uniref:Lipoprotein n=1 Tax=Bernardetia litoralis (strain ATCC 23117 / DSM 6794 / NBRC 15988 / NCIMB 1366 / Fx l1 / Sio-4) TaxID=880071 RepID=I4AQK1_BERLS|nr:hypothetical protein Fleli_3933 [Bernardetia litoralis DSM 6794]
MKKKYFLIFSLSKFLFLSTFLVLFLFIFGSCNSRQIISENLDEKDQRKVIYGQPVSIKNTDFTIVPMQIVDERDIADARYTDDGKTVEDISQNAHNLIFFDEKTKETHLLTTQKFKRIAFSFEEIGTYKESSTIILYKTIHEDYNKDGFYDWKDAVVMYVSDDRGRYFRAVTPKNTRTIDWTVEKEKGQIYFRYISDSDSNRIFDLKDPVYINKLDLKQLRDSKSLKDSTQISTPLINAEERKRYEDILLSK